jgi:hypothetical protein
MAGRAADWETVSVSMPKALAVTIRELATSDDRSVSSLVRRLVMAGLKQEATTKA